MTALRKTPIALTPDAAPYAIRAERASDVVAREALLDACFGENRHMRTCQRLRDGRTPAEGLALSAVARGKLVGTLRLWHVSAGGKPALMLGPLAVEVTSRKLGVGAALMDHALAAATARGHRAVILLGDAPYYARYRLFGREDRRTLAARAVRARPPARPRAARGRARWRLGHDRALMARCRKPRQRARRRAAARAAARCLSRAMTSESLPEPVDAPRPRLRSLVTTILFVLISVMIVRDILVRRWSAAPPPSSDVTQQSR